MYTKAEFLQNKECEHLRNIAKLLAERSRFDAMRFIRNNLRSYAIREANDCLKILMEE